MKYIGRNSTLLFIIIFLFCTIRVSAQDNPIFKNIIGKLVTYTNINSPEKVYLQTDKDFYTNGENLWFKAYVLNGVTHTLSTKSLVVYVELVDKNGETIAQRNVFVGSKGASADITIPDIIEEGTYKLRAFTKYMLNEKEPLFYEKEIGIWAQPVGLDDTSQKKSKKKKEKKQLQDNSLGEPKNKRPIVQFFPEGGDLVNGIECVIGVKVTDNKGNGIALKGKIFDQNKNLVSIFRTYEFGLGRAYFKPEPNTNYYTEIQFEGKTERYEVMEPLTNGYALQVLKMGEYFRIRVSSKTDQGLKGALLLGHLRGDLILKYELKAKEKDFFSVKLSASELRDGIVHFTLFAPNGEPVCERLIFVENPENELRLSLTTNRLKYNYRDKVNIDMAVVDQEGKPLNGDFSMSVVTKNGLRKDTENIKSWLLLNSDLGGTIENPDYFFDERVKGRKYLLDLLMLTHGWRRFAWHSFKSPNVGKELSFPPEKGIMITGNTTAFENRYQPKKAFTTLNILAQNTYQTKETTNAQGKFSFGPFFFQDSVETVINAKSMAQGRKKAEDIAIYLDANFPKVQAMSSLRHPIDKMTTVYARPYLEQAKLKKIADFKYDPKITKLKEVVVKSKSKTREQLINEKLNSRTLYGDARNRVFPDSVPWMNNSLSILDILRTLPGIQVFGSFPNQSVQIRNSVNFSGPVSPLYLLDGMPVRLDLIQTLPVLDVLFVDVLVGADAAIYGSRAGGGVIAIYTKRGEDFEMERKAYPGVANFTVPGFYKTREFYAPNYALSIPDYNKPDHRTTLHWEPNIALTGKEPAEIQFYTGDSVGEYTIRVEGMTFDGRPLSGYQSIQVIDEDESRL